MRRIQKNPFVGLRLADYNNSFAYKARTPTGPLLLKNRAQNRYRNVQQEALESVTVIAGILQSEDLDAHKLLENRLSRPLDRDRWLEAPHDHPLMGKAIKQYGLKMPEIQLWVDCWKAKTVANALSIMEGKQWPAFLLLYTFNRQVNTRQEAHTLMKLYERTISQIPPQYQVELAWLALDIAQRQLIEYLVPVCRIFLRLGDTQVLTKSAFNELLWKLCRYGTQWAYSDLQVIKAAQKVLVDHFGQDWLDLKGFVALAYVAHFESPSLARQIINAAPAECLEQPGSTDLPYVYGPQLIMLHTCESFEQGLTFLNSIDKKDRVPAIWAAFVRGLVRNGHLDDVDETALKLWSYWLKNEIRISSQMVGQILCKIRSFKARKSILDQYLARGHGTKLTPFLLVQLFAPVYSHDDYNMVKSLLLSLGPVDSKTLVAYMHIQTRWEPGAVWETYKLIQKLGYDPCVDTMTWLCQAASDPGLVWDGMYAAQRATQQVKDWIQQKEDDVLKSYPSENLVHSYIKMLGLANYQNELNHVLTWLSRLDFRPSKQILCALIVYSEYGPTMKKLATKSTTNWPTEHEIDVYMLDQGARSR